MAIDTFLFDFDGTLVDSHEIIYGAVQTTIKEIGLPPVSRDTITSLMGMSFKEAYKKIYFNFMEKYPIVVEGYERRVIEGMTKSNRFFPTVLETLNALKGRFKLGIVTSSTGNIVKTVLKHYRLSFDAVVTADDTEETRPDPKPVILALSALKSVPKRTMYVGNAPDDVMQGRNAGIVMTIVTNTHKKEDFDLAPDFFISKLDDVLALLKFKG